MAGQSEGGLLGYRKLIAGSGETSSPRDGSHRSLTVTAQSARSCFQGDYRVGFATGLLQSLPVFLLLPPANLQLNRRTQETKTLPQLVNEKTLVREMKIPRF